MSDNDQNDLRQEARALVAQVRTNLALRGRSGLQGVPTSKPGSASKP